MTRLQDPLDGISQEALAGLVAQAVQQALMQHGFFLDAEALVSTSMIAGSVAAALPFLPHAQRLAIGSFGGDLPALTSEFFGMMTKRISRSDAASDCACDRTAPTDGMPVSRHIADRASDLQAVLIEDWAGEVAGSTYLEEKFRIPRSTLHRWQRRGEVVALRKGGRKHVFPLAQFVDGRPALGIREVLAAISNPRLAWLWLTRPCPELDGRIPIEMLREDLIEDVAQVVCTLQPPPRAAPT
ncbi:antitoxin Xre/MbcA/ParS toxin-binding domain-containing protein [Mesorhizobium japonicum]|uniref:Mll9177 protein n=1 Tax=Mesorhizobium japonicum (strain LMG 29417 / CECT 9101 / MAFF 303099) TaxID=266835 RepID=Q981Z0_RHILO|nr:antitoxin Xre/MbcA/ParS toxin-binding domain-containing protein [Mesorhizobium japonicum]BAB54569.1 mll9177 [Mesorhizobium japonicum MAFF 303099]